MPKRGKKPVGKEERIIASKLTGLTDITRVSFLCFWHGGGQRVAGGAQALQGKAAVSEEVAVLCNYTDRVRHNV